VGEQAEPSAGTLGFEGVYRRNVGFVFRLLKRFGVHPAEVEDAAQEVFMIVHRRLAEFDATRGTVRSWIFAIVRGVSANRRRSNERRGRVMPPAPPASDGRTDPEQRARQRQVLALVDRFLQTLSAEQREAFELVDIEGMRGPEVSQLLEVKVNTIYTRLRAARLAFKDYLERHGAEIGGAHA
jgi:RNA polymerase sigma-70 factor (ECF subfamily)